jgi:PiT family inorganic phosphate transporter
MGGRRNLFHSLLHGRICEKEIIRNSMSAEFSILLISIIAIGLIFDLTNGFHDAANAIATVVATKALTWNQAIILAALANFAGAFLATRVAGTIENGIVTQGTQGVVLAALIGAIAWNLITWRFGLPSSSSHALVGGLVGAAVAHAGWASVLVHGIWDKVVEPMIASPVVGFLVGAVIMGLLNFLRNPKDSVLFRRLQIFASVLMALAHGSNDAQKTMGIITLALIAAGSLPAGSGIPPWVVVICAASMAAGTLMGGKRIVETTGNRIVKLDAVSGFAASSASAGVVFAASFLGAPVSTTHVVVGSVTGVGSQIENGRMDPAILRSMVTAWLFTLPAAAAISWIAYQGLRPFLRL